MPMAMRHLVKRPAARLAQWRSSYAVHASSMDSSSSRVPSCASSARGAQRAFASAASSNGSALREHLLHIETQLDGLPESLRVGL